MIRLVFGIKKRYNDKTKIHSYKNKIQNKRAEEQKKKILFFQQ